MKFFFYFNLLLKIKHLFILYKHIQNLLKIVKTELNYFSKQTKTSFNFTAIFRLKSFELS